jgi:hypothetical protein
MEEATRRRASAPGLNEADRGSAYYDLACFYSLAALKEPAFANLEKAFRLNPTLVAYSLNDNDLDPIRDDPRYKAWVKDAGAPKK